MGNPAEETYRSRNHQSKPQTTTQIQTIFRSFFVLPFRPLALTSPLFSAGGSVGGAL